MLPNRLKELREKKDIRQEDLGAILNVGKSTISQYESGKRNPDTETLNKLADFFVVCTDYLLGRNDNSTLITNLNRIPVLGLIRAGLPILAEENWEDEIELPTDLHADFSLRVKGDSMSWMGIQEGDLALMRQTDTASHGMIVAAAVNGMDWDTTLKFYIMENGQPVLRAANPDYEDIKLANKYRIIGQLVNVLKEPPLINQYKSILIDKELADKGWAKTIEKGVQLGFNGDSLEKAIEVLGLVKKG